MSVALEVKGLRKEYKNFCLEDVSFSLQEGCILGFIGPNGAGKSTTIKAILNQIQKDAGEIRLWGKDNIQYEMELKDRIGVLLDEGYFYGHLSLKRMKNLIAPFYKSWNEQTFQNYLQKFRLDEDKKISELSKGMRMKYAISLALSHQADLLIMDEPTSGLDPLVREELLDILQRILQDEKKSVFFSTHITSDLDKIADYVLLINDGKILLDKPKDEMLEGHAIVKGAKEMLTASTSPLFVSIKQNGYGFEALTKDRNEVRRQFGDKVVIEKPTVEDIMLFYVRRDNAHAELD